MNADLTSLASKVGRANRFTGQPVNDNPFNDGVGPNNEYIWARGFRNPFTMTFQPGTGALWLNVVGTNYEQVFVVGRGDHGGYNQYENNQTAGFLEPTIVYRTNGTDTRNLTASGAVRTGGVTTFTTVSSHGFRAGAKITIAGVADASFNGTFFVRDRLSDTSFTVSQAGPDANSGGGSAQTAAIGGALTGGYFYDSTLFPQEYHGNFFFGDYNSGVIARAVLDSSNKVTSVDSFITGSSQQVDITTGPDGALYYAGVSTGVIRKLVPEVAQQNLIIHPTALNIQEGGRALFTVRLAQRPSSRVKVKITKVAGGDANITTQVSSLTFNSRNWDQLQSVVVYATNDGDLIRDRATFRVSASGIAEYDVVATEIDSIDRPVSTLLYRSGDQVPGEPEDTVFAKFGLPSLDGTRVGFLATIQSGKTSLPAILGGASTSVLVRKNDAAPDTTGVFSKFKDPVFGGGRYAFIGTLKTGAGGISPQNNDGIWSDASGSLWLLAREGSEAPGTDGAQFQTFLSLALPDTGSGAVFVARLKAGSGQAGNRVKSGNDVGLWREVEGAPVLVLREGMDIAVDAGPMRRVKTFQTLRFVKGSEDQQRSHRADGDLLVLVNFQDGTQAIMEAPGDGSPLVTKVLTADTVTAPVGTTLKTLDLPTGSTGGEAFVGTLNSGGDITEANDTALFFGNVRNAFAARVREGDTAPNTDSATFAGFSTPILGRATSTLTFLGTLKKGTGTPKVKKSNDTGIWTNAFGSLRLLAREGSVAPGTSGSFAKFLSVATAPNASTLRAIPFTAKLRRGKGITAKNDTGLWAMDKNGIVWLLQRTGDDVPLPDLTSAKITALSALKTSTQTAGQGRATNNSGQIIYRANLRKKGQAIFRVQMQP